ncbi:MAG: alcohol dehydrogenase catalytic domain-containing protein, partial [Rhodospirillales bacterium]|nr:alcohol dehydrogenase catalytic domain-containing protein [Rhodospirillales bacterium]
MAISGHRWDMTAPNSPMVKTDVSFDIVEAGDVIVEIAGCGVCHTDMDYIYNGVRTNQSLPLCLGHEISGHVVATGEGASAWKGKPVIIPAVIPCGTCDLCKRGLGTICRTQIMPGNDVQGGFATHITIPSRGLCEVDMARLKAQGMTLADVSVVADAVTTPYQAALQAGVKPGDLAIIIGVGG